MSKRFGQMQNLHLVCALIMPEMHGQHTFDDVLSLTRRFHLIEPIVSKSENDDVSITNV